MYNDGRGEGGQGFNKNTGSEDQVGWAIAWQKLITYFWEQIKNS